jgi:membrane-associated phospholipid phosphatase
MEKKKIARLISRIFSPLAEGPFSIWLASQFIFTQIGGLKVFLLTLFFVYLLPFSLFLFFLKQKKISDWDIKQREQRYNLFSFTFLSIVACLLIFYFLGEKTLVFFYLRLLLPVLIFFITTFFYKISGHMLTNSIFILLLYLYTNKSIIICLGILWIIMVGWARVKLKRHTLAQVVAGALLPLIILI